MKTTNQKDRLLSLGKKISVLLVLFLLTSSCESTEESQQMPDYNAKVLGKGLDCGNIYLIQFDNDVTGLPPNSFDNTFYALNLPANLQIDNLQVNVAFRAPNPDEMVACTTMGIGYPQIVIETAN